MADINFMQPDSVPLIAAAAVKAALAQRPAPTAASTPVGDSGQPANTLSMTVTSSRPAPNGYILTLSPAPADTPSAPGSQPASTTPPTTLNVNSTQPLPEGTRLVLQLPPGTTATPPGNPLVLNVLSLTMPGSAPVAETSRQDWLTTLATQILTSRLALLPPATPQSTATDVYQRPTPSTSMPTAPAAINTAANATTSPLLMVLNTLLAPPAGNALPSSDNSGATRIPANTVAGTPAGLSIPTTQPPNPLLNTGATASNRPATPSAIISGPLPTPGPQHASAPSTAAPLPAAVQQILQQWQQQLPAAAQLSQPDQLQQAVRNSGISYEQQLFQALSQPTAGNDSSSLFRTLWQRATSPGAAGSAATALPAAAGQPIGSIGQLLDAVRQRLEQPPADKPAATAQDIPAQPPTLLQALLGSDQKAVLGRALLIWAQQLHQQRGQEGTPPRFLPLQPQPDVPETFRLLQTALARTETEQVLRLQQGDTWQLNIPLYYRDGDTPRELRLHLSKEEADDRQEGGRKQSVRWRLRLHFDLQHLGPLDIDLELQLPALSATFWSQQAPTLNALNRELQPLRKRLQELGVEVQELQVRHGQLPEPERNRISQRLIDTHS